MHVRGESDDLIVPTKRTKKFGASATAEFAEGKGSSKGTALAVNVLADLPVKADQFLIDSGERARLRARQLAKRV
jgi:hypothetical protein